MHVILRSVILRNVILSAAKDLVHATNPHEFLRCVRMTDSDGTTTPGTSYFPASFAGFNGSIIRSALPGSGGNFACGSV